MAHLIAPEELPQWVPGKVLLASDGMDLGAVSLRSYRYNPSDVEVPAMRDFMLVAYREGPTSMDRQVDGPWAREELVPGDVSLLTRAEKSHWHWTREIDVVHLYLTRDLLARVSAEVFDRDIEDVRLRDVLKTDNALLGRGIAAVEEEVRCNNLGGRLYVDAVTTQLCVEILRRFADVSFREERSSAGLSPLQTKMVTGYIETNLDRQLTLDELAEIAHVSSSHFLRQFKRRFGCAPHSYVIGRRVACAQRLLDKTRLPIKEIALKSGFSDQSHMTRIFQRILNTTPSTYRDARKS